jgi:hypothetical protein
MKNLNLFSHTYGHSLAIGIGDDVKVRNQSATSVLFQTVQTIVATPCTRTRLVKPCNKNFEGMQGCFL